MASEESVLCPPAELEEGEPMQSPARPAPCWRRAGRTRSALLLASLGAFLLAPFLVSRRQRRTASLGFIISDDVKAEVGVVDIVLVVPPNIDATSPEPRADERADEVPVTTTTTTTMPTTTAIRSTAAASTTSSSSPPTSSSSPPDAFEELPGSVDGACRSLRGGNDPLDYTLHIGAPRIRDCKELCFMMPGCRAIEWAIGRCEVWLRDVSTVPVPGFTCLRRAVQVERWPDVRKGPLGLLEKAPSWEWLDGLGRCTEKPPQTLRPGKRPLGEYGSITQFDVGEEEARRRVRQMASAFDVREFQFYGVMDGLSRPPTAEEWRTRCGGRTVRLGVLKAYVEEVKRVGGRPWLYVPIAADPGDAEGSDVEKTTRCGGMDVVSPSESWALRAVPRWLAFAKKVGFAGIHWDALKKSPQLPQFLRAAARLLHAQGVLQTCNFLDGASFSIDLLADGVVEFPYWEVWDVPSTEDRFFTLLRWWAGGVLACYPGKDVGHANEAQNKNAVGTEPTDVMIYRWARSRSHGAAYLAVGDGLRRVAVKNLAETVAMGTGEVSKVQQAVFRAEDVKCSAQEVGGHLIAGK